MRTSADVTASRARCALALLAVGALALASTSCGAATHPAQAPRPDGSAHHGLHHAARATHGGPVVLERDLRPGQPAVQSLVHDRTRFTVAVNPARPGWNLVRVDVTPLPGGHDPRGHRAGGHRATHAHAGHSSGQAADEAAPRVGTDASNLVPARRRPGASGRWARVWLPAGDSRLLVSHGPEHRIPFAVDTGERTGTGEGDATVSGPDGPECLAKAVGALLAGGHPEGSSCPAERLQSKDEQALRAMVGVLDTRGYRTLAVLGDASTRSRSARRLLRRSAEQHGLRVVRPTRARGSATSALVAVSGWQTTGRFLAGVADDQRARPLYTGGIW
ncbi:MAG: hypothetical protein ACRDOJ_01930, partial [Nocardioidaceae bacterium]